MTVVSRETLVAMRHLKSCNRLLELVEAKLRSMTLDQRSAVAKALQESRLAKAPFLQAMKDDESQLEFASTAMTEINNATIEKIKEICP